MTDDLSPARELAAQLRVAPGAEVVLGRDYDPGFTAGLAKADGKARLAAEISLLASYQDRLAAQARDAVLVVLQGIDAAGKDGTIRHVMSGVNPQGVPVHSFKAPSAEERAHDYLWRHQRKLPERGQLAIFNRSHYEEVLVVRVHPALLGEAPDAETWTRRFAQINAWERHLTENGTTVVKLLLTISRAEQRERFLARIDRPEKNWKFSGDDARERHFWDAYQDAFSAMLTHTSTAWAPWHVIPADHKWFGRLAVGSVLVDALARLDPRYPEPDAQARRVLAEAAEELRAEG